MIRFLCRFLAIVFLAIMVMFAIVDITRSIGASAPVLTPLAASWDAVAPGSRTAFAQWLTGRVHPVAADPVLATVTAWPVVVVFGVLALLFAFLGARRRQRSRLFERR